jgi:hypothetical protein
LSLSKERDMKNQTLIIPLHRQLMLAQPDLTGGALRQLAGLAPNEELLLHRDQEQRVVTEGEHLRLFEGDRLSTRHLHLPVTVTINRVAYTFEDPNQTGASLKIRAGIVADDALFLTKPGADDEVVTNETKIHLQPGMCFFSQPAADYGIQPAQQPDDHRQISISINRHPYHLDSTTQTGNGLKRLAGILLEDVLFLVIPGRPDVVIANNDEIVLKSGSHLFSQPAADYGTLGNVTDVGLPPVALMSPQPGGWVFVAMPDQRLPEMYQPNAVEILVKLPPQFPDAAPDMFWVRPAVHLANGTVPNGASMEHILGEPWMRFSWHLKPGAWQPGISSFADFHRCIRARFERGN